MMRAREWRPPRSKLVVHPGRPTAKVYAGNSKGAGKALAFAGVAVPTGWWCGSPASAGLGRPLPARCRIHALALRPPPATRHAQHPLEVYAAAAVLEEEEGRLAGRTTQPKLPSGGATGDALRRIVTSIVRLPRGHLGVRRHLLRLLPMDGPLLRRRAMAARPLLLANHRHLPVRV